MDIDIDVAESPLNFFPSAIKASMLKDEKLSKHPVGVYFQEVPTDPISGLSAIPYNEAEQFGCFKVDFLPVHVYDHFTSHEEIKEFLKHDPDWKLLEIPSVVNQLFQVSKQYELINLLKPTSIVELADCLAIMRPQKRYLKDLYIRNRTEARKHLYSKEGDSFAFKKSHSICYAMVIVLQLHLIKGGINFCK